MIGYWSLVFHSHLPYVRHPEYDEFLEEDWLFEALTETYIPLLNVFEGLVNDGVDFRASISITPPLSEMLADGLLKDRYLRYLNNLIGLIDNEVDNKRGTPFEHVACMYQDRFYRIREIFTREENAVLRGFRRLQDWGKIEIITCAATHGFMPLIKTRSARDMQIRVAVDNYRKHFGRNPRGFWLPECAYVKGIEDILQSYGIKYFFVDTHGILYGEPRPRYANFAPVYCPGTGVAAFARDVESSKQVWSAREGYPGDYQYREFYRDLGFDAPYEYIRPFLHKDGRRRAIGIKYYKITGTNVELADKHAYIPWEAFEKAKVHAENFYFYREKQLQYLSSYMDRPAHVVSPYDTELFGHWWFEGPEFLNQLFRKVDACSHNIKLVTPSEYLHMQPMNQVVQPCASSWGNKGYYEVWVNGTNDWIYPHLHYAEGLLRKAIDKYSGGDSLYKRVLNQMMRELLLAQASDWAFIMNAGTMVEYAHKRTKEHILSFLELYHQLETDNIDREKLKWLEFKNNIFREAEASSIV